MVRDFTEKNIKPVASLLDEEKQFPRQNLKRMADLGLMGMNIPVEFGGSEVGVVAYSLAITEIAKGCASTRSPLPSRIWSLRSFMNLERRISKESIFPNFATEYTGRRFCHYRAPYRVGCGQYSNVGCPPEGRVSSERKQTLITSGEASGVVVTWAVTDRNAKKGKGSALS